MAFARVSHWVEHEEIRRAGEPPSFWKTFLVLEDERALQVQATNTLGGVGLPMTSWRGGGYRLYGWDGRMEIQHGGLQVWRLVEDIAKEHSGRYV